MKLFLVFVSDEPVARVIPVAHENKYAAAHMVISAVNAGKMDLNSRIEQRRIGPEEKIHVEEFDMRLPHIDTPQILRFCGHANLDAREYSPAMAGE